MQSLANPANFVISKLLELPLLYSVWSGGVDGQKQAVIEKLLPPLGQNVRVLDVGCGPATNTSLFARCGYTGFDANEQYVKWARELSPDKEFLHLDATSAAVEPTFRLAFDVVLISSMLHHLNDEEALTLIRSAHSWLKPGGVMVINEPVKAPPHRPAKFILMKLDRGDYFRSRDEYLSLLAPLFRVDLEVTYPLKMLGFTGWRMLALKVIKETIGAETREDVKDWPQGAAKTESPRDREACVEGRV